MKKVMKKSKRKPGELAEDKPIANADVDYKIKIHNVILDTVVESIHHLGKCSAVRRCLLHGSEAFSQDQRKEPFKDSHEGAQQMLTG